jgi:ligand-binding sensor domain-containing protein/two-component sensor histidine kinase
MRILFPVVLSWFAGFFAFAQQQEYSVYTTKDGLPSNYIYRVAEDDKGFLWVATDAGIARFDGKYFQVFTTENGLPDNEVLSVVKETNGQIWVNCFGQGPAYFDEVQNRFINAKDNPDLGKIANKANLNIYTLPDGVMFNSGSGSYVFKNKKLTAQGIIKDDKGGEYASFIKDNPDGTEIWFGVSEKFKGNIYPGEIARVKGNKILERIPLNINSGNRLRSAKDEGKLYIADVNNSTIYICSFQINPLRYQIDTLRTAEPFTNILTEGDEFYTLTNAGKINVWDKKTLKQQRTIGGDYLPNSYYKDSKGNIWVSTIDKGLVLYGKNKFRNIQMPDGFTNTNFLSIATKPDGTLLAGNYYGQILEIKGNERKLHQVVDKVMSRQRKILIHNGNVYSFADEEMGINYQIPPVRHPETKLVMGGKTAVIYNDSIIVIGTTGGFLKLNTKTNKVIIRTTHIRVTSMVKADSGEIYFGSIDGLYKFNVEKDTVEQILPQNPLLKERVTAVTVTPDGMLWAAMANKGIVVIKDNKVIQNITVEEGLISNFCLSVAPGKTNQIWVGTSKGISVVNYKHSDKKIKISIQNLSTKDGLTSNGINEMFYRNDTVYAATADGISVISADITIPEYNIPVYATQVMVNQRDTIIAAKYALEPDQKNIFIRFAAIELDGHFKNLQYTLDDNDDWISLKENILNLQLTHGNHTLQVRAVDVNGRVSKKILKLEFNIRVPFWETIWFWLITGILIQIMMIYFINRYQKKRKEEKLAKKIAGVQTAALEQQAFTSLMNPHFIFNALNSIQHYINVQDRKNANRYLGNFASLIRKNFDAAHQSFIPLEEEIENIKIYLNLELMRFSDRFRFSIQIEENLDAEDWMIPTMILQPLLENALLHGIMPSTQPGEISIRFAQQEQDLWIVITDNGIGISNSRTLKNNGAHKSRGMELISKRIKALSHFGTKPITIQTEPAFESETNPGTKVTLLIPNTLYDSWRMAQA